MIFSKNIFWSIKSDSLIFLLFMGAFTILTAFADEFKFQNNFFFPIQKEWRMHNAQMSFIKANGIVSIVNNDKSFEIKLSQFEEPRQIIQSNDRRLLAFIILKMEPKNNENIPVEFEYVGVGIISQESDGSKNNEWKYFRILEKEKLNPPNSLRKSVRELKEVLGENEILEVKMATASSVNPPYDMITNWEKWSIKLDKKF